MSCRGWFFVVNRPLRAVAGLRFLTYNLRVDLPGDGGDSWAHRRDEVVDLIGRIGPDVAGYQEVVTRQMTDLRERLPQYVTVGRGRGEAGAPDERVPISYRGARFAVVELAVRWLSPAPEESGSVGWDAMYPRIATVATLHDTTAGGDIAFVVTHLDHEGERARLESAERLRSMVDRVDPDLPVVLAGDFNCGPGSEPYERLVADTGERHLRDAEGLADERVGPAVTYRGFGGEKPGNDIDHVFVTRELDVRRYVVRTDARANGRFPSDHFPVVVDLEYSPG